MKEYLKWFDSQMIRPTLLLMDNFTAHEIAVDHVIGEDASEQLRYTRVMWLPPNATSLHQPLDQGIIQNWKSYVKRSFVAHIVNTFDTGEDPKKATNVLLVIRWGILAWEDGVRPRTIQNYWA